MRLAPARSASYRLLQRRSAFRRSAPRRHAPLRSLPSRSAPSSSAPFSGLRDGLPRLAIRRMPSPRPGSGSAAARHPAQLPIAMPEGDWLCASRCPASHSHPSPVGLDRWFRSGPLGPPLPGERLRSPTQPRQRGREPRSIAAPMAQGPNLFRALPGGRLRRLRHVPSVSHRRCGEKATRGSTGCRSGTSVVRHGRGVVGVTGHSLRGRLVLPGTLILSDDLVPPLE